MAMPLSSSVPLTSCATAEAYTPAPHLWASGSRSTRGVAKRSCCFRELPTGEVRRKPYRRTSGSVELHFSITALGQQGTEERSLGDYSNLQRN
jgi:hypothetical protein